eukprot:3208860-Rhodomonas_salina.1
MVRTDDVEVVSSSDDEVVIVNNATTQPEELALLDGGCTSHLHPDKSRLVNLRSCDKRVQFGDMCEVKATVCGDWPVKFRNAEDEWVSTLFKNVLVCEPIPGPIISEKRMRNWGHDILSRDTVVVVLNARTRFENVTIQTIEGDNGLTYLPVRPDSVIHTEHCALSRNHRNVGGATASSTDSESNVEEMAEIESETDSVPELEDQSEHDKDSEKSAVTDTDSDSDPDEQLPELEPNTDSDSD